MRSASSFPSTVTRALYGAIDWPLEVDLYVQDGELLSVVDTGGRLHLSPQAEALIHARGKIGPGGNPGLPGRTRLPADSTPSAFVTLLLPTLGGTREFEIRAPQTSPAFAGASVGWGAQTFVAPNTASQRTLYDISIASKLALRPGGGPPTLGPIPRDLRMADDELNGITVDLKEKPEFKKELPRGTPHRGPTPDPSPEGKQR